MTQISTTIQDASPRIGRSLWADAAYRLYRDKMALACFCVIVVYVLIAIISPFAFPGWSDSKDYDRINEKPSQEFWLGTDIFGRSIFQETLLGASTSMTVGFMANIIAVPLGMLLGAIN